MRVAEAVPHCLRGLCAGVALILAAGSVAFAADGGAETGIEALDPAMEQDVAVVPADTDGEGVGVPPAVFVLPRDGRGLGETERSRVHPPVSATERLRQQLRGVEAQIDGVDRRQRIRELRIRQRERVSDRFQARRQDGRSLRLDLERRNLDFRRNVLRQELRTQEIRSLLDRQRARPSTSRPPYRGLR